MTTLSDIKTAARKEAKARRKLAREAQPHAATQAMAHFLDHTPITPTDIVSGYRPIFSELDPSPLMNALHERGIALCVPVIDGEGLPLSFRRWTPDAVMVTGAFGAEIPEHGETVEPTLLIAPLLAFDRHPYRLGYGGGFYDRTLERLRALRPTRAIGYAYAEQEMNAVPIEPTDQLLDAVATPQGMITPSG